MSLLILFSGLFTFLACFFIHVLWWRLWHPKNDISSLLFVFLVIPSVAGVIVFVSHIPFVDLLSVALLHLALSSAYIMSYPAAQAKCPSLNIMLIVDRAMPDGAGCEEIEKKLGGEDLLDTSVKKMLKEGFIKEEDSVMIPTGFGRLVAYSFIAFRAILGIKEGKG